MKLDNWLSKNVRPVVLLFLVLMTILLIFIDGVFAKFNVADNWISLLELVLITVIGAYFGGRSFEKLKDIDLKKNKNNQ
jgi:uncharacterized membrane protein|tara:strand:+ start:1880 stop:2116 length:237 start_codon:yes stop_codon:yes gene_type:complete